MTGTEEYECTVAAAAGQNLKDLIADLDLWVERSLQGRDGYMSHREVVDCIGLLLAPFRAVAA